MFPELCKGGTRTSGDPNAKTGPGGFGVAGYVTPDRLFTCRIDFENGAQASAPAQQVVITDPLSTDLDLSATANPSTFPVSWTGTDTGAGVTSYDIYVSIDAGPWLLWLSSTMDTSALFTGRAMHTYAFYSVARDGAGLSESPPSLPDTQTTVTSGNGPPLPLQNPVREGNTFSVLVPTEKGKSYLLEFKNSLNDTAWTPLPAVVGDGTMMMLSDPSAPGSQRYYRVRIQ